MKVERFEIDPNGALVVYVAGREVEPGVNEWDAEFE